MQPIRNNSYCKSLNHKYFMETLKKYLGVILLLVGVLFLVLYRVALPVNALLICGIVFEVAGILAYIFINKKS